MPKKNTLSGWQQHAYAFPAMGTSFLIGSLGVMQGIYAKYYGLSLSTLASLILIANLFDAATDPLIGYYSDRYYRRAGSRKPFIVIGGLLLIISSYFLYAPVDLETLSAIDSTTPSGHAEVNPMYFLGWYLAFYFSWTMFEIPHLAWGGELAVTSYEKTRIYSVRAATAWCGILLFYLVPLLPMFETQSFTAHTLYWAVLGTGFVMLPLLYLSVMFTPDIVSPNVVVHYDRSGNLINLKLLCSEVVRNKPLMLFLMAVAFFNISVSGMWLTLLFIFVDIYLGLGEKFAQVSLTGLCVGLPMMLVWYRLANRLGKKSTLVFGLIFSIVGIAGTGLLEPGTVSLIPLTVILIFCFGAGGPAFNCIAPSMLSDIVDYGHWKFGQSRGATYFSLYSLVSKVAAAVGSAAGLAIVAVYFFDPTATSQSAESLFGLRLAIAWIPASILSLAVIFMLGHPITSHRHHIIRRRIDAKAARMQKKLARRRGSETQQKAMLRVSLAGLK